MTRDEEVIVIDILNGNGCEIADGAELQQLVSMWVSLKQEQKRRISPYYRVEEIKRLYELGSMTLRDVENYIGSDLVDAMHYASRNLGEQLAVDHASTVDDGDGLDVDDAAVGLQVTDAEAVDPI